MSKGNRNAIVVIIVLFGMIGSLVYYPQASVVPQSTLNEDEIEYNENSLPVTSTSITDN